MGWYQFFGEHSLGGKWGAHLEMQVRRMEAVTKWQQFFVRPAVMYQINDRWSVRAGYGYFMSWPYGDFPARFHGSEHRVWQQVIYKHKWGKADVIHRFRFENRWLSEREAAPGGGERIIRWRYQNRFRYFAKALIPLKGRTGLSLWDEILLNVPPNIGYSAYDHNRAFAGFSRRLSKNNRVEFGYMNQAVLQRSGRAFEHNHALLVAWFSTVPFAKR